MLFDGDESLELPPLAACAVTSGHGEEEEDQGVWFIQTDPEAVVELPPFFFRPEFVEPDNK